jgi:hypothetical protein
VGADILNDVRWLSYIRAGAKARFRPEEEFDISDFGEKVREIIKKHLVSLGVQHKEVFQENKNRHKKYESRKEWLKNYGVRMDL